MSAHSKFSASAAHRWMACPGSIVLTAGMPDTTSIYALEGTIGHALADLCLKTNTDAWAHDSVLVDEVKQSVDEGLQSAVQRYVDLIRGRGGHVMPEVRVNYKDILVVDEADGFGTSDAVVLQPDGTVEVWDLKLGHKYVSARDNKQLALYASGVVDALEACGEEVTSVLLGICQPRVSEEPSVQTLTREELAVFIDEFRQAVKMVKHAEEDAEEGMKFWADEYLNPGEDQCRYCKASGKCPAQEKALQDFTIAASEDEFDVVSAPALISDERLITLYRAKDTISQIVKAVEDECFRRAQEGKPIAGTKLVAGREGNRKWADEKEAAKALTGVIDNKVLYNTSVCSPAVAEKELKKAKVKDFDMSSLIVRSAARNTLALADDPREAVSPAAGAGDFE